MIDRLLQSHLEPIARDYQRWRLWRGLARVWATAGLIGLGFLLIHRFMGWSPSWTFPALVIASIGAAATVVLRFRKAPPDYRALARRIEEEYPKLHALLLTAVEQQPDRLTGELNYLQQRVIGEALKHHRQRPWGERIFERLFFARCGHWLAFLFLLIVLAGLRPSVPTVHGFWATRSNGVTVTPGDTSLERGSGLVVLARFDGKLPAEATLVIKPTNENEQRVPLMKNLDDPVFGGGIPEVNGDLAYRIESSTGQTRDFKVAVFDYPRLERADAKLTYPEYTGLPERTIQDTRRVSAVEGSLLDYSFYLNKAVATAKLVAKDKTVVPLASDTNNPSVYHTRFTLDQSKRYELVLVDDAGRTNKVPPEFVIEMLKNRLPELKLAFPRGDQRVSALEEIAFQAEVSDDFGLRSYGIAYALAGQEAKVVELGQNSNAHEKRPLNYLLPLENLAAEPDQLLSYYVWADDVGPDGNQRRTTSDMFFAEVKPFDEIFREGQTPEGGGGGAGEQQGNQSEKLAELQKQIISATWNLKRRETGATPSEQYKKDVTVVHQSQGEALEKTRAMKENVNDPRLQGLVEIVEKEMEKAETHLSEAVGNNSLTPLPPALTDEQSAYQALLKLSAREYQVSRGSRNQRGGGGGGQRAQRQVDQLDLKQAENRYETQREASPAQNPGQREQLQVANRLKELAQRQQDLNERLKEMQTALQEAKTQEEREEIRRRLKRLREEQQELLADVDELRQRMERPENQSRMAEARQQLDQTRSQIQNATEALEQDSVPQALASGTRAQRELQQLQDEFRKKSSGQFAEDMRRMRNDARELAQKQEEIARKLDELDDAKHKTLSDSEERRELANQLTQQKGGLTNLFTEMRQVSEQSETAEPLLSKQLYDLLRQTGQDELNKSLDLSSELVQRGFLPQASQFEQRTRRNIDELKRGVERAAESVLGDDIEALRLAKRELEDLSQQLEKELAQADKDRSQRTDEQQRSRVGSEQELASAQRAGSNFDERPGRRTNGQDPSGQQSARQPNTSANQGSRQTESQDQQTGRGENGASPDQQQERRQQTAEAGQAQGGEPSQGQPGRSQQRLSSANSQRGGNTDPSNAAANDADRGPGQRNASRAGARRNFFDQNGGPDGGGGGGGPLTGDDFVDWSDRLRDVEEMLDIPDLRTEVARIRDRARAVRLEYRRHGEKPDWAVVRLQIAGPLVEVRSRVSEELARRESNDALVPIDRDPVPARFSELVRRYYEQLGKSD